MTQLLYRTMDFIEAYNTCLTAQGLSDHSRAQINFG